MLNSLLVFQIFDRILSGDPVIVWSHYQMPNYEYTHDRFVCAV